jgi:glycine/D-amino acid oxidase-like deaminating enzyme
VTKAIVIGGGIGGLTAAAALGRAGVEVAVFAVFQMENPLLCRLHDAVAKRASARARLWQYEKIARYRV